MKSKKYLVAWFTPDGRGPFQAGSERLRGIQDYYYSGYAGSIEDEMREYIEGYYKGWVIYWSEENG